jgi:hypothetical protein
MTYYESAEGVTITRERAFQELKAHGHILDFRGLREFFRECGNAPRYNAQRVLEFLGY